MVIQSPIFLPTSTDFGVKKYVAKIDTGIAFNTTSILQASWYQIKIIFSYAA